MSEEETDFTKGQTESEGKPTRGSRPRQSSRGTEALPIQHKAPGAGWAWECDAEGIYTKCSPEIEGLMGYKVKDVLGNPVFSFPVSLSSRDTLREALIKLKPLSDVRVQARTRRGAIARLSFSALPRSSPEGDHLGYQGVARMIAPKASPTKEFAVALPHQPEEVTATTPVSMAATWGGVLGYADDGETTSPLDEPATDLPSEPTIMGSRLVVPIRTRTESLGVIEFDLESDDRAWSNEDRVLAEAVALQLALALQDARSARITEHALDEIREADHMKSLFLANMSHEVRTPLNSIIGFSRVVLKGIDGPISEAQQHDIQAIYDAGHHLLKLMTDVLDLSKIEAGKMELDLAEIDPADAIRSVVSTSQGLVRDKDVKLIIDLPEELPHLHADSIRLRQVLLNLVSNAAKFTEEGEIKVSAKALSEDGASELLFMVSDTGPGIAPQDQEKVFQPFSQLDGSPALRSGGSGLGLSICRHLVELHGGRIWVESELGKGSTFYFTFPLQPQ